MLVSEITTAVQRIYGDESFTVLEQADIIRWINDGQLDIVRKTGCLITEVTANTAASTTSYTLPTNFLFAKQVMLNYVPLIEFDLESNQFQSTSLAANALPTNAYMISEGNIYFPYNQVLSVVPYRMWYVKRPTTVTVVGDTPEIPVQFHEDLVRFCLARAEEMNGDFDAADRFAGDYNGRVLQARADTFMKSSNSFPAVRCNDDYDY